MLGLNFDFPLYYILFCIILGVGYASFLYKNGGKFILPRLNILLFSFRTIVISIIAFLLLNPVFKSRINYSEDPIVIIAKDNSESVKQNVNNRLQYIIDNLEGFDLFTYSFSDKIEDGLSLKNNGLKTDYSNFFYELGNKFENRNVAGIIIASDGCYNAGSNPEYLSYDFPVYSIPLGDTATYKDVRIDQVLKNDIAFLGNTFPIEISIASSIKKNHESKIKIWNKGVKVHEESITFLKDVNYNLHTIHLPASKIGLQTYTIEIEPLDGEKNLTNNIFHTYIDIIDSRWNILILKEGNHPDLAAYKSAIENSHNYMIEVKDINDDVLIDKYQLVVMFGVNNIPKSIIDNDVPVLIFNSLPSHYINLESAVKFSLDGGLEEISCYKNQNFSKFSFSSDLLRLINNAPPLFVPFGRYHLEGNIESVLNQKIGSVESNNPIIMIQDIDSRKMCFISGEGWWRWRLYDYFNNKNHSAFNELFLKLSQYLILQEDKSLFRLEYEKKYDENDEVSLRALLYNESYELVNNKEIYLKIIDRKGREYDFQFLKEKNELIARLGLLQVGTYNFVANVQGSDLEKRGVFDIRKIQLEQLGLSANHSTLHKISSLSNGKVFYLNELQNLVKTIKDSKRNKRIIHYKEILDGLINFPWILLSLLIMISFEWFLRKFNGLI